MENSSAFKETDSFVAVQTVTRLEHRMSHPFQFRGTSSGRFASLLSVIAAFTASACLFLIELFAGKQLLPQFGGAPGVWISCLAFFQLALVGAYWHADRLIRHCSVRMQVALQAMLFAAAAVEIGRAHV